MSSLFRQQRVNICVVMRWCNKFRDQLADLPPWVGWSWELGDGTREQNFRCKKYWITRVIIFLETYPLGWLWVGLFQTNLKSCQFNLIWNRLGSAKFISRECIICFQRIFEFQEHIEWNLPLYRVDFFRIIICPKIQVRLQKECLSVRDWIWGLLLPAGTWYIWE